MCRTLTVDSFLKWKLDELKKFLKDRGVVISGRKADAKTTGDISTNK